MVLTAECGAIIQLNRVEKCVTRRKSQFAIHNNISQHHTFLVNIFLRIDSHVFFLTKDYINDTRHTQTHQSKTTRKMKEKIMPRASAKNNNNEILKRCNRKIHLPDIKLNACNRFIFNFILFRV